MPKTLLQRVLTLLLTLVGQQCLGTQAKGADFYEYEMTTYAIQDIGTPPSGSKPQALAINSSGVVCGLLRGSGFVAVPSGSGYAFRFVARFSGIPGDVQQIVDITDTDVIAGYSGHDLAFVSAPDVNGDFTRFISVGSLPGCRSPRVAGINESFTVAGTCHSISTGKDIAFVATLDGRDRPSLSSPVATSPATTRHTQPASMTPELLWDTR